MKKENDMNKLGDMYDKSVIQRETDVCRLDFAEKHQWKVNIPTSDDIKDINNLVENYMKGDWGIRPNSRNISEDVQNLLSLTIDVCEELKSDIECKYIAYLLVSATRSKKLSRKWEIYKFLYIDKPLKQLTSKLSGKKFRLYNYIPRSEIWKMQQLA